MVPSEADPRSTCDSQAESALPKPVSGTPKDSSKKKKVNRQAKLKQCKLDARREQWLSQGKNKIVGQQQQNGISGDQINSREDIANNTNNSNNTQMETPRRSFSDMDSRSSKASVEEEEASVEEEEEDNEGCSSEEVNSKIQAPDSSQEEEHESPLDVEDEEEHESPLDVEDDWEAAADALNIEDSSFKTIKEEIPSISNHGSSENNKSSFSIEDGILKPEYKIKSTNLANRSLRCGSGSGRAWRPDDVSRPNTLPKLTKLHSFPSQSCRPSSWSAWNNSSASSSSVPVSCPICYEDLDVTDSNFVPCACGFRLCLFCHKRIIEHDGRCPGCRKRYNVTDTGAKATILRLPRSCSMRLKA